MKLLVYHDSTISIENPLIFKTEIGRDFGSAFYTTDIREQVERWARRRSMIQTRIKNRQVNPIVSVYEWDEKVTGLSVKRFDGSSLEWLDMSVQCRSNAEYTHGYDIVVGKIANDSVGETVQYVLQGIMRKEDALERLKFEKINNQIAFCSEAALKRLRYISSYLCEVD